MNFILFASKIEASQQKITSIDVGLFHPFNSKAYFRTSEETQRAQTVVHDLVVVSYCKYYDASFFSFPRILVLKHTSKTWKAWEREAIQLFHLADIYENKYSTRTQKTRTCVKRFAAILLHYPECPNNRAHLPSSIKYQ